MDSDERLYERVRRGDLSAFDELYARYESSLFGFLRATLGSRANRADAEDALHEAFLNTLRSREVTFDRGGFRSWLFRIARNVALNRRRKDARGVAATAQIPESEVPPTVHDRLEAVELRVALDGAVARLPPTLAEVYRLRTSGLSYEEIADVLETPLGTVKSRMHEMVKQLREDMGPWTARG
jgi:RNA polymerase sigma-70 factor (ECF subfamily)